MFWIVLLALVARPVITTAEKPAHKTASTQLVSISQTLAKMKDHSAFYAAMQATGWEVLLDGPGSFPYTVFAPTNQAFANLSSRGYAGMVDPANKNRLRTILSFHMVAGNLPTAKLTDGQVLSTSTPLKLTVTKRGGHLWVTGGTAAPVYVHSTDVQCDNGVIHVIDEVLLPLVARAK